MSAPKSSDKVEKKHQAEPITKPNPEDHKKETPQEEPPTHTESEPPKTSSHAGVHFTELSTKNGVELDLRYATNNNFTHKKIYDCGRCYLRPEAAENLLKAQQELKEKFGYSFKIFDCFRPKAYQQRLWDIVPDADYVTPPAKGSMHSRGLAVDLTLIDEHGKELDMGTPFDYFGEEAHYSYDHPEAVKRNRWILKSTMERYGFGGIRTEWWHFSYRKATYPLDEWVWECH
ncbi:MAG: D-alanyl-D-alanine dipeptidase [Chitinophagales bacterium]|nr:D-alanyl-D-alanine dipeptidase [Chitinophagales bacterium]